MNTKEKIIKFEKYLNRNLAGLSVKQNIMDYLYDTFTEELKETKGCKIYIRRFLQ